MSGGWFAWTAVEPGGPPVPGCWWGVDAVEVADMVAAEFRLAGVEVAVDAVPIMSPEIV